MVFLSKRSLNSKWVKQEIYEALYDELESKQTKLIPCLLEKLEDIKHLFPQAFTKSTKYERLYIDFSQTNNEDSINYVLRRISKGKSTLFKDENVLRLEIPIPDLEIYMTGDIYNWTINPELKYFETINSYLLFGFKNEPYSFFKHFVYCDADKASIIRFKLESIPNITVTGTGSVVPGILKQQVWFCVWKYPIEGAYPYQNNKWI
jgi:hypothetical protein